MRLRGRDTPDSVILLARSTMLHMQRQQPSVGHRTPLHPTVDSIEQRTTRRAIFELMRDERCEVELVMLPIVGHRSALGNAEEGRMPAVLARWQTRAFPDVRSCGTGAKPNSYPCLLSIIIFSLSRSSAQQILTTPHPFAMADTTAASQNSPFIKQLAANGIVPTLSSRCACQSA